MVESVTTEWSKNTTTLGDIVETKSFPCVVKVCEEIGTEDELSPFSSGDLIKVDSIDVIQKIRGRSVEWKHASGSYEEITHDDVSIPVTYEGIVQVLPKRDPHYVYHSIQDLMSDFPRYVITLDGIESLQIPKDAVLETTGWNAPHGVEPSCFKFRSLEKKNIKIHSTTLGRFQVLRDDMRYTFQEVIQRFPLLQIVQFTDQTSKEQMTIRLERVYTEQVMLGQYLSVHPDPVPAEFRCADILIPLRNSNWQQLTVQYSLHRNSGGYWVFVTGYFTETNIFRQEMNRISKFESTEKPSFRFYEGYPSRDPSQRAVPSPNPFQRVVSSPDPVQRAASSSDSLQEVASSPDPLQRISSSSGPLPRMASSPGPLPRMASSPGPLPRMASSPGPLPRMASSPGPLPRIVSSPDPLPRMASSPDPLQRVTSSPGPLQKVTSSPDPSQGAASSGRPLPATPMTKVDVTKEVEKGIKAKLKGLLKKPAKSKEKPTLPQEPKSRSSWAFDIKDEDFEKLEPKSRSSCAFDFKDEDYQKLDFEKLTDTRDNENYQTLEPNLYEQPFIVPVNRSADKRDSKDYLTMERNLYEKPCIVSGNRTVVDDLEQNTNSPANDYTILEIIDTEADS